MEDDELLNILDDIGKRAKILKNAPITVSFAEKNITAIVSNDDEKIQEFMKNILTQIITFQNYEDLKLVFLLSRDVQKKWEYVKMLPHIWNNKKQMRFFADNIKDMEEISKYLEEEFTNRLEYNDRNYKSFMPYYLIITDNYKKIAKLKIITEILKEKNNLGFSIICITKDLMQVPNECKTFIDIQNDFGRIFESEISSTNQINFQFDRFQTIHFEDLCKILSNIPIRYAMSGNMLLPNSYTFLEMYDVGLIEQLNVLERWKENDATLSLQAPIGIDDSGRLITLDIHEKFHGPHGLIAGSTGSGKSEFIITYILSLAVNYHPDDLTFILIDYKGGGLAGAFQKGKSKLPHLVGTITNIDTVGLQRSLASIQSELRRRQIIFNEARNITDEGTIDIYKYQKLYHDGIVKKPVPHLLIICDEFAELKQQQEEFMNELISVSRIGRSLGVHLILATQKPSGIVNDQIRSNSKFAVCLKVQDREDSTDVIKRPDAAYLKATGQFYLQVGNDEYFILGQSAWSGAAYVPSDITRKKEDNAIEVVSNIGAVIKRVDDISKHTISSQGEQLTNIVKYLYELAKEQKITVTPLWLENIPETIFVDDIRKKYGIIKKENNIDIIIGEYDDPANQRQGMVNINCGKQGNVIIYGNAESGKETLLSTAIYDIIKNYSTEEIWLYILDFGSEALKIFKGAAHVGDVIFINETEKINRFFEMIRNIIKDRKNILSDYNGDYELYLKTSKKNMPKILVIINGFETFFENYEDSDDDDYDDVMYNLTKEGIRYGVSFIVTTSNYSDLRYRLSQNFKRKIALQLNNEDDYYSIFENVGKKRPQHIFGRGLIPLEDGEVYEFQTAKICESENWKSQIIDQIEKSKRDNDIIANKIPVLPEKVKFEDINSYLKDISAIPIGILKKDIRPYIYDFRSQYTTIITGKKIEEPIIFTYNIIEQMQELGNVNITILDAEKTRKNKIDGLIDTSDKFIKKIDKNANQAEYNVCIIIGVERFINYVQNGEEIIEEMLKKAEDSENYSFIFVEDATKMKNYVYNQWFKSFISDDNGLWIGNGIKDQYLIKTSSYDIKLENNCGRSFGYVIKNGEANTLKLLEMQEKGDDNE